MHPIIYYTISFAIAGAAGMAVANRRAEKRVRRNRWLKYFTYLLITATVITSIVYHFFSTVSVIIAVACLVELTINNAKSQCRMVQVIFSYMIFFIIASAFLLYSHVFKAPFLLFIYFQVLIFDAFCQIAGQLWGKHPLVSLISPSKTIEGLAGGWLCCIAAALLAAAWIQAPLRQAALFGLLTGFTAFCGDLLASFYKRKLNIKDYSNWLPGQGGFLDRFDSLLFTGCMYYLLCMVIFNEQFSVIDSSIPI